jgi:hypothetical protein
LRGAAEPWVAGHFSRSLLWAMALLERAAGPQPMGPLDRAGAGAAARPAAQAARPAAQAGQEAAQAGTTCLDRPAGRAQGSFRASIGVPQEKERARFERRERALVARAGGGRAWRATEMVAAWYPPFAGRQVSTGSRASR